MKRARATAASATAMRARDGDNVGGHKEGDAEGGKRDGDGDEGGG